MMYYEVTKIAEVAVEGAFSSFDKLYSYNIPRDMEGDAVVGARVAVPFGAGNKHRVGLIFSIRKREDEEWFKPIHFVLDKEPILSPELLKLCAWTRENVFCTYFEAFRAIVPPGLSYSLETHYKIAPKFKGKLDPAEQDFIKRFRTAPNVKAANAIVDNAVESVGQHFIDTLVQKGALTTDEKAKRRVGDETLKMIRIPEGSTDLTRLTPKQKQIVGFVQEMGSISVQEACYICAINKVVVTNLIKKGTLETYENVVFRTDTNIEPTENPDDIILSKKQKQVYDGLEELMDDLEPKCALLRGVTGSGKTSIFIKLIAHTLSRGKTALMLVPEISLTPQMVDKFRRLFGNKVAVMHSSLSTGERADEYRRIKCGKARIVIGTRSAVFAPVDNLGIVVIDEEGEGTYKSESTPRYHARDIAKQRCFAHNAFLLLASATPSLESYYYAKNGRYSLFELDERYSKAALPEVYIVDMREEAANGNVSTFSEPLVQAIRETLSRGEQSILLLNRRGYNTTVTCTACGKTLVCPSCKMPLTYHKSNGSLICHYCGYIRPLDTFCPECYSRQYIMSGTGTQRIEDEITTLFPTARVLRMDADTTSTKKAFEEKFKAFADGEYDIIVGTQMIAKGLDFPNVTLVGVLKTDNSLYSGDFRAYERTFSLITQVVGRSGRSEKHGRAYIQTYSPEHYVINLAAKQDYPAFYEQEIALREAMLYPPFCDIAEIALIGFSDDNCLKGAAIFKQKLGENAEKLDKRIPLRVLGPAPFTVLRYKGMCRYKVIVKCKNSPALRTLITQTVGECTQECRNMYVRLQINMNSISE